uniref:Uncharacterized protein n=1 Tax=Solanum lycopersicum TaxID=4081 RepID=A0A3Q7H8I4_SOLLC
MNLIQDVMGFLIQFISLNFELLCTPPSMPVTKFPPPLFVSNMSPMITKLLLGGPEKGERTVRTGKTTALLLSITPFLEVVTTYSNVEDALVHVNVI